MLNEIRYALRRLRATPVITLSAVACLAIGVWMTCIVSAIGFAWFWPNLRIPEPQRVVQPAEVGLYSIDPESRVVSPRLFDAMSRDSAFAAVGQLDFRLVYLEGDDDHWLPMAAYSSGMMGVLRVHPILGRGFIPADDTIGGVMILSHRLWRVRYGGDSNVIGRMIRLKNEVKPRAIIGVMPENFSFPHNSRIDAYLSAEWSHPGPSRFLPERVVFARLEKRTDRAEAEDRLRVIAERTIAADRADMKAWLRPYYRRGPPPELPRGTVETRLDRFLHPPIPRQTLRLMLLILACGLAVVAVAVANVVNLLLVRGAARRQEIAVRMALGADRLRVVRELVIETLLLAAPALAIGLVVAWEQWRSINPSFELRSSLGEVDARVAIVGIVAALILSLIAGVWPGLRATSVGLEQVLRDARRSGMTDSPLDGLLSRLVTASTAVTVMLLTCAALLGFSARDAANDLTRTQAGVLASDVTYDDPADPASRLMKAKATLANLRRLPGVASAALGPIPLRASRSEIVWSHSGEPTRRLGAIEVYSVTDGYFETMAIQVLRGRAFSMREARDSSGLVVISRELAGTIFGGRNAVGERFRFRQGNDSTIIDAQVIGVAENVTMYGGLRMAQIYRPYGAAREAGTTALVRYRRRVRPQPTDVTEALKSTAGITVTPVTTIAERMRRVDPVRHYMGLGFAIFAIVGLVIAIVGTYGVVAYSVIRRTHEIGVRLALGADGGRVSRMVIEQGMKISLVGVVFGIILAAAAVRILGAYIQDLEIGYGGAIGVVIALMCLLAFVASAIPAWRASRLNPVDALRAE